MSNDEAEWRTRRFWLWAGVALEAAAWFAAVLILHWLVRLATT